MKEKHKPTPPPNSKPSVVNVCVENIHVRIMTRDRSDVMDLIQAQLEQNDESREKMTETLKKTLKYWRRMKRREITSII